MTLHHYQMLARALLALLLIIALGCAWSVLRQGIKINTDLKNLSPAIAQDPVINQALDSMSQLAARQFTLLLTHPDDMVLEEASEALQEKITAHEQMLHYVDRSDVFADYLVELAEQPFNFLDSAAHTALATHSDKQLQTAATARLYANSQIRLLPLAKDPLGYLTDFAVNAMSSLGEGGESMGQTTLAGEEVFYAVHNLMLTSNALDMGAQDQALRFIRQLEADLQQEYPALQFLHSGIFFFAADAAQSSKKDISLISTGSALGILFLVLLIFRSVKALLLPALSIITGTVFAFIMCQVLFGTLHIFTLIFGASLIGVVVDYALHYFYFHSHQETEADSRLFRALLLSLVTSVIGYSALSWSGLEALKQVAVFSGLGLAFSWLVVISFGPWLVRGVTVHDTWLNVSVAKILHAFAHVRTVIWLLAALSIGALLLGLNQFSISSNDSPRALFSPNPQLIKEEQLVNSLTVSTEPSSFIIVRGNSSQDVYTRIEQLEQRLNNSATKLTGVHNFFPSPENSARAFQLNQRLYGDKGLALEFMRAQGFTAASIEELQESYAQQHFVWPSPADFFARHADQLPALWLEHEERISTFLLLPKAVDLTQLKSVAAELDGVTFVSVVEETTDALQELRRSALSLLAVAFAFIAALMLLRFRSLQMTFTILIVPLLALAGTVVILNALQIPLTLFHVMALFLVLGLGMDYIIFVIEMWRDPHHTLSAIVLSAVTSFLAFGLLAASDLPAVSGFGLTVLIGNGLNLLGGLVVASRQFQQPQQKSI
jgi:predicted exporter